jgi:rod shape-determining protein MreC
VLLIRLWAASLVTPFERAIHGRGRGDRAVDELRGSAAYPTGKQGFAGDVDRLRLEQAELHEDALQGQRLQALVKFRRVMRTRRLRRR